MKAIQSLDSAIEKVIALIAFLPLVFMVYPETVAAAYAAHNQVENQALVFEINSKPKTTTNILQASSLSYNDLAMQDVEHQQKSIYKEQLREYLLNKRSPFYNCVDTIVELKNADKILALANAESGLGRFAPAGKHNYWGVGGSKLWKMGNTVCEGLTSMDNFLNEYPRRSAVKYSEMSFVQMCGLYKQPCPGKASHHWVKNNNYIIQQLNGLKAESKQLAIAQVETHINSVSVATFEVALQK